jgi:hypothetical protein
VGVVIITRLTGGRAGGRETTTVTMIGRSRSEIRNRERMREEDRGLDQFSVRKSREWPEWFPFAVDLLFSENTLRWSTNSQVIVMKDMSRKDKQDETVKFQVDQSNAQSMVFVTAPLSLPLSVDSLYRLSLR